MPASSKALWTLSLLGLQVASPVVAVTSATSGALVDRLRRGLRAPAAGAAGHVSSFLRQLPPQDSSAELPPEATAPSAALLAAAQDPAPTAVPTAAAAAAADPTAAPAAAAPAQTAAAAAPAASVGGTPAAPQDSDVISEEYWIKVNKAIAAASLATPRPSSLNDPLPAPTPEPWRKVFQASQPITVIDTPAGQKGLNNWERATPAPPESMLKPAASKAERTMSVVPYDMQIGARIMYGLSEKQTATPPPSQAIVNEAFVAQCPMVMFADRLSVRAPRCGSRMGQWADPATDRTILRWKDDGKGSIRFGVDSLVTGNGSVPFAEMTESFSVSSYVFDLYNCLNVKRYTIEESVIKVNHMAAHASSTMLDHDLSNSREAIFYKYTIKTPSGKPVAATAMFRMDQDAVNISKYGENQVLDGGLIGVASRQGHWKRDQWRQCTGNPRSWDLQFPEEAKSETVATVQDLRVAAAAVITMMAYRSEETGADGFQHVGQGQLYWSMVRSVLGVILAFAFFGGAVALFHQQGLDKKCRRLCFRLEQVLLPRRPVKVREPALNPTY